MSQPESKPPKLVENDSWLAPYSGNIEDRIERFSQRHQEIIHHYGNLTAYAGVHLKSGISRQGNQGDWLISEWLPDAKSVSITGDFNDWDRESHPLTHIRRGIWQCLIPHHELKHLHKYKLHVRGLDNSEMDRIPACARYVTQDSNTQDFCPQLWEPKEPYRWQYSSPPLDQLQNPLIYEAHIGMSGEEARVHSYREFADQILPRIKNAGYQVVQLMAIAEHPYYGSFGYHVSNFFAPSSRFGTPEDLKYLIDQAHRLGLGVLMDIVHSHAVKNIRDGLNRMNGGEGLYFHAGERGNHPSWDSKCFDYGRPEVRRFLLSNLRYWLEEFQFDGFRFDGVTSMLYWHRGEKSFDHFDHYFSEEVDHDAIIYLQLASQLIQEIKPGALMIAEDMSGMPGLCRPIEEGGLGMSHRLAMGIPDYWIKLLKHQRDEEWDLGALWGTLCNRRRDEKNIAYAESHDQALVGDKTLAFWLMDQSMYESMHQDQQSLRVERGIAYLAIIKSLTLVAGGEGYLNFMGNEFGHPEWIDFPREGNDWSYQYCRRQWSLRDHPQLRYGQIAKFDSALTHLASQNNLLSSLPAQLLYIHEEDRVMMMERNNLLWIYNFSGEKSYSDYKLPSHQKGSYQVILTNDTPDHGGHNRINKKMLYSCLENQFLFYLPSRTITVLKKIS